MVSKRLLAVLVAVLVADQVGAQVVELPNQIDAVPGAWVPIIPKRIDGGTPRFHVSEGLNVVDLGGLFPGLKPQGIVVQGKAGTHFVWSWNAKGNEASPLSVCIVRLVGPGPEPGPEPGPGPGPEPGPAPIAGGKVVLWFQDTGKMSHAQRAILTSTRIREVLATFGKDRWRVLDVDAPLEAAPSWVRDLANQKRDSLPWITVVGERSTWSGPLPGTVEETITLLRKLKGV